MTEKHIVEDRSHDSGVRNADHRTGSDTHEIETPRGHYVDPAEEAMNSNPNISPPIHPRPN